jgi:hypothetical protein
MEVLERIYGMAPGLVTRKIGDRIVIIPIESQNKEEEITNSVFTLNDMAAGIWVQINGQNTLRDIKAKIIDHFEVSPSQAEEDLLAFVSQLEEAGLVFCNKETG